MSGCDLLRFRFFFFLKFWKETQRWLPTRKHEKSQICDYLYSVAHLPLELPSILKSGRISFIPVNRSIEYNPQGKPHF